MKINRTKIPAVLALCLLLSPVMTASRVQPEYKWALTPFMGMQTNFSFGKLVPLPQTADVPEIEILLEHKSPVLGLNLGYRVSEHWELQGILVYDRARIMNDAGIGLAGIPMGKTKASDATVYAYSGSVLYYPSTGRLSPYLAAGVGAVTLRTVRFDSSTKLLFHFGAGLDARLSRRIHLVLDVRDSVHSFDFGEDFAFYYALIYSQDFRTAQHSLGIRLGLKFLI